MKKTLTSLPTIYPMELAQKGEEVYDKIKKKLEKESYGKFVAIEVDSQRYFIGESQVAALEKAREKFPNKVFYFVRIGFPAVFSHSSMQPIPYGNIF